LHTLGLGAGFGCGVDGVFQILNPGRLTQRIFGLFLGGLGGSFGIFRLDKALGQKPCSSASRQDPRLQTTGPRLAKTAPSDRA